MGLCRMRRSVTAAIVATGLLAGCAGQGELEPGEVYDPIEPANRMVFAVNDTVDTFVLQPTAYIYKEAVPDPVRDMVRSFLEWLKTPVILANDLFQGNWDGAGVTASRFVANAPFFGFVDNATGLGLEYREEDFGQTLAVYGAGDGPYIVLPLLGPSNARDTVGLVVDHFLDPINYIGDGPLDTRNTRELLYGRPDPLDSNCFDALRGMSARLAEEGRELMVVSTPLHPKWKEKYDPDGTFMADFDKRIMDTLSATGGTYWNADKDWSTPVTSFVDAVHMRWSVVHDFTAALAEQMRDTAIAPMPSPSLETAKVP